MTVGFPPEEQLYEGPLDYVPGLPPNAGPIRIDAFAIALLILLVFLIWQLLPGREGVNEQPEVPAPQAERSKEAENSEAAPVPETAGETIETSPPVAPPLPDPSAIAYPYDEYWVTQGPHGMSYGHMAIDLAAGKGATVKSPIYGTITANYIDQYGNTTLIIENERYQVLLLHGDFTAVVGQTVVLGDAVGTESNHGYTTDMYGRSCRGRDCGYHSHLNVFDKSIGQNVNPLDVLAAS